ncbi:MAG: hypothetical protein ACTSWY_02015 [Promethearchaeota archaeon]
MIISRTEFYEKKLPKDVYEKIIDFLLNYNNKFLQGRSIESVFEQCVRIFLANYFEIYDFSKAIPQDLIELFFKIKPNTTILKVILPKYRNNFNPRFKPLSRNLIFSLKDIKNLSKIFPEKVCIQIFPYIIKLYEKTRKSGYTGTVIYLLSKYSTKINFTQKKLAEIFELSNVTLRSRNQYFKKRPRLMKIILKDFNFLLESKTIEEINTMID